MAEKSPDMKCSVVVLPIACACAAALAVTLVVRSRQSQRGLRQFRVAKRRFDTLLTEIQVLPRNRNPQLGPARRQLLLQLVKLSTLGLPEGTVRALWEHRRNALAESVDHGRLESQKLVPPAHRKVVVTWLIECAKQLLAVLTPRKKYRKIVPKIRIRLEKLSSQMETNGQVEAKCSVGGAQSGENTDNQSLLTRESPVKLQHDTAHYAASLFLPSPANNSTDTYRPGLAVYLATTFAGFEHVCVEEISRLLGIQMTHIFVVTPKGSLVDGHSVMDMSKNAARGFASGLGVEAGVAFCGKVIFAVAESVPSHVFMERLRTVQSLYAFVASTRDVLRCKPGNKSKLDPHDEGRPIGSPDQQLQELSKLLSTQEARKSFQSAFASWKNFQMALSKAGTAVPEIRVRGSTARSGRHYVPSVDIAQVVASAALDVVDSLPWAKAITVDLDNFNCEVAVLVSGPFLAVGILLTSRPLVENHMGKGRLPKSSRSWMVANEGAGATLRPSTAYILCKMAGARPGDVFADIMGGAGTIPMEAASSAAPQSEERVFALTGDRDSACTETASGNYRRFHRHFGTPKEFC
eukprot:INCI6212.2.p1 GENE.INCI6212.2~~INCI6212.2.p1  ORF type:complete len:579 (-),score=78.62 INCI6212.2:631-2367(-)